VGRAGISQQPAGEQAELDPHHQSSSRWRSAARRGLSRARDRLRLVVASVRGPSEVPKTTTMPEGARVRVRPQPDGTEHGLLRGDTAAAKREAHLDVKRRPRAAPRTRPAARGHPRHHRRSRRAAFRDHHRAQDHPDRSPAAQAHGSSTSPPPAPRGLSAATHALASSLSAEVRPDNFDINWWSFIGVAPSRRMRFRALS
jgi:hypothetical protein